jgi:protein TonB
MLSTTRFSTVIAALMLTLAAPLALAAENKITVDPKDCEVPDYPVRWQNEGDAGSVTVAYLVGADGKVQESKVLESSGYVRVDRASVRAGARCKFQQSAKDGQVLAGWAKVKYSWIVD